MGLFDFWHSKHRSVYCKLALRYGIAPWKVYRLAHGKAAYSAKEVKILRKLREAKVIAKVTERLIL